MTGPPLDSSMITSFVTDAEVAAWPISHPIQYTAAFRHELTRQSRDAAPAPVLDGSDTEGDRPFR